jgi:hypothetical protein
MSMVVSMTCAAQNCTRAADQDPAVEDSAAANHGLILARVFASAALAISVSWSACRRSHQLSDSPKKRHSRRSVSAMMDRLPARLPPPVASQAARLKPTGMPALAHSPTR